MLLLVPLVASAWTRDWWAPDEPRYAQVAREIYTSGEFLVMHLCGAIYRSKPPLLFWISGALGSLTDWSELAMRLPSLASTLVSAWLVARLARRFWGEEEARLAPILYLTTAMVLWHGARMQIDPLLGALCFGALVIASEPCANPKQRGRNLLAAGLLAGLGVLAKGPIALVLIALPLLGWRWVQGAQPVRATRAFRLLAVLAALAPGLCWALAVIARRPELAYDLFLGQFFERAVKGTDHVNPFWYHFFYQPLLMLPWTVPILGGSWLAWRALRARWRREAFDPGIAQCGLWLWSLMIAFSLSPEKRDLYLLPAYPAAALLAARWILQSIRNQSISRAWNSIVPMLLMLVAIVVCCARLYESRLPAAFVGLTWQPFAVGIPLALAAALSLRGVWRADLMRATVALASGLAVTATLAALIIFPMVNPLKSARSLSARLAARPEQPSVIPVVGVMPEGYRFYSGRPVVQGPIRNKTLPDPVGTQEREFLEIARREGPQFLALVERKNWNLWSEATRASFEVRLEQKVGTRQIFILGTKLK
ncbi:MAG TPA: glycosyltransferase family 39 protein [Planctomycetota bacterium]|nr:glycosyltransferase family 39 protein [Planctomycetota bacterium]